MVSCPRYYEIFFKPKVISETKIHEICKIVKEIICDALKKVTPSMLQPITKHIQFAFIIKSEKPCDQPGGDHLCMVDSKEEKKGMAKRVDCKHCQEDFEMKSKHFVWLYKVSFMDYYFLPVIKFRFDF